MLRNSFIVLDGIGEAREKTLWKSGIRSWEDFLDKPRIKGIAPDSKQAHDESIRLLSRALLDYDSSAFIGRLPGRHAWRIYDYFRDDAVFLDIETSGVGKEAFVTVIGLYDGFSTKTMIRDVNLDFSALYQELSRYKMIVTYNGSSFDLPFVRKRHGAIPDIPHFDVRHACRQCGLKDGLKSIERSLGIRRPNVHVDRLLGGDPYKLWRMFKGSGDDYYLNLLVEYNEEDVINLKQVADSVVRMLKDMHREAYGLN